MVLSTIIEGYHYLMDNQSDQRVNGWFLMSSPFPTLFMCLTYAYCVTNLGPKLMENRKPFDLTKVLRVYNLIQVIFSTWLFRESIICGWLTTYSFICQPIDYSDNPIALRMVRLTWWYYISKFTEFFDTIFFVLRKKNNQITTLHVIHHGIMPLSVWFGVKFLPGGHVTFFGFLNTFVHIVMYAYYLLAALGPSVQKYLWWKKYLTILQMGQFVLVMIHSCQLIFIDCDYNKSFVWFVLGHAVMFYFLFSQFYKETYVKKNLKQKVQANNEDGKSAGICFTDQTHLYKKNEELKHRGFVDSTMTNSYH